MARKNLLASVTGPEAAGPANDARADYARRGASRTMMLSIDERAESAKKMIAGEAVVSLDASLLDGSFVADRIAGDDLDYSQLRDAIREQGQTTPILVRPHPEQAGRYMIVFGHRRARVARELGTPVRAVVKDIADIAHIVAQGQENTARANLSFIEKALFAKKLLGMGQSKQTVKSAMTVDDTLLSRMLAVAESVPVAVIEAIGAAKPVGRDRWEDLKKRVATEATAALAVRIAQSDPFLAKTSPSERFDYLVVQLKAGRNSSRKQDRNATGPSSWFAEDKMVTARISATGKTFSLSLTSKHAGAFGQFISSNLEQLYQAFKDAKIRNQPGD